MSSSREVPSLDQLVFGEIVIAKAMEISAEEVTWRLAVEKKRQPVARTAWSLRIPWAFQFVDWLDSINSVTVASLVVEATVVEGQASI